MRRRLLGFIAVLVCGAASAADFRLANGNDSGTGSLRWAIEQANASPVYNTISSDPTNSIVNVALASPLPPITGWVGIQGQITIDGTNAGEASGLIIERSDVTLTYLKVKNFKGDGIVIRGDGVKVTFVESSSNRNGIVIEGRRADIRSADVRSNTANGIWITASGGEARIGVPAAGCFGLCAPEPGPDTMSGNGGAGMRVDGDDNIIDSAKIEANGGDGLTVTGARNVVINSTISANAHHGVKLLAQPKSFENNVGSCNGGEFIEGLLIGAPRITFARSDPTALSVRGDFHGLPNKPYRIEIHTASLSCPATNPSASAFQVRTDSSGFASWSANVPQKGMSAVTAVASGGGEVSRMSDAVAVFVSGDPRADLSVQSTAPATAAPNEIIEIVTVITNNGPSAVSTFKIDIPYTWGTSYFNATTTSGICWLSGLHFCKTDTLGPGESVTILERLRITAPSGTLRHFATASHWAEHEAMDPNPVNNTAIVTVAISRPRHRGVRH